MLFRLGAQGAAREIEIALRGVAGVVPSREKGTGVRRMGEPRQDELSCSSALSNESSELSIDLRLGRMIFGHWID